ncbi:MAG: hypothetical protein J4G14_14645 [Dehalococcoidia bacterium]|nr:hypothetical protein [Dehalococcoidia bacterium]
MKFSDLTPSISRFEAGTTVNDIAIWLDTDITGSITHFWFEQDGYRRICDNQPREDSESLRTEQILNPIPCQKCKSLYLEDVLHGRKALRIWADPPVLKKEGGALFNDMHSQKIGGPISPEGVTMPKIPMSSFARFYEVRPAEQVRIVRDIRTRLMDPEGYIVRDYYGPLRNQLKATHWTTRDIEYFEDGLELFLENQKFDDRRDHYRRLSEAYVSYWHNVEGGYFTVPPTDVTIAGLTITVRPEVGLRTVGGDYQALKLWFNSDRPSRQARQFIVYLMNKAKAQNESWGDLWYSGIWDIRRQNVLPPIKPARDLELGLTGQIAAFLHIWDDLDRRSREGELPY